MQDESAPPKVTNAPHFQDVEPEQPPVVVEAHKKQGEGWRSALSTLSILIAAPLVALALTAYVFQSYEVDGPSMESTLQNKDRLIVLKLPRTWSRITHSHYIPNRGDIIIFVERNMQQFGDSDSNKQLVKRVIGLPGDRVVVADGKITVYNTEHPEGYSPDTSSAWAKSITTTTGEVDTIVQPGEVFVCGDNRENSLDSRYFGSVPADDIVGKLALRVFPLNQAKVF